MKKQTFTFAFIVLAITTLFGQSTYQKTFDWADDLVPENLRVINGDLYFPVLMYNEGNIGFTTIYKFNDVGEVLDSIQISEGLYCWVFDVQKEGDNLMAFASSWESPTGPVSFIIYNLTQELQLISTNIYPTSWGGFNRIHGFIKNNGNHVIIGDLSTDPMSPTMGNYDIYIAEINANAEIVKDTIYNRPGMQVPWAADYNTIKNTFHLITDESFDPNLPAQSQYNELDSSYKIIYSDEINSPVYFYGYKAIKVIDSNSFFQAGDVAVNAVPYYDAYGICRFNNNYDLEDHENILYNNDTTNKAAFYKCFDYYDLNSLYFIGTVNYKASMNRISYLRIIKLDSNFNVLWDKYYGGDRAYFANEIKALEEGGCIITTYYKDAPNFDKRRVMLLKLDQNGLITSTNQEPAIPIKNAIITPNPGNNYLQLHTGIFPATLQIFNTKGQMVLERKIQQNSTTIQTQTLAAGTYVWQLQKDGSIVEVGKWVKE
jgi:hypothetical protein